MKYQSFRRLGLGLAMGILCACIACFAMLENPAFKAKADGGETTDQGKEWFVRFTWNGPVASAEAVCENGETPVLKPEVTMSEAITTKPTCTVDGVRTYTAKVTVGGKVYTDTRTQPVPAPGHAWGTPSYIWAADNRTVTATVECKNCDQTVAETVNAQINTKSPTYAEKGVTTYTAEFGNALFPTQTREIEIPVIEMEPEVKAAAEAINALSSSAGLEDREAVTQARAIYDRLTDEQKAMLGADVLNRLTSAEQSVQAAEEQAKREAENDEAKEKQGKTDGEQEKVEEEQHKTDEEQGKTEGEEQKGIEEEEEDGNEREDAGQQREEAEKRQADERAANAVAAAIEALSSSADLSDREDVMAARAAYDALTEEQKALIPDDVLEKLKAAEQSVQAAEEQARQQEAAKRQANEEAANAVAAVIEALSSSADLSDREDVMAARAAYDALTDEQKALVPADVLEKLKAAEQSVQAAEEQARREEAAKRQANEEAANAVAAAIEALSSSADLSDREDVIAARAAYDALTDEQKALIPADVLDKLKAAEQSVQATQEADQQPIQIAGCRISVKDQTFTGKALKPAVTVRYEGATLRQGKDYTLSYRNNKKAGTGMVTVTGMGGYTGAVDVSFTIAKAKMAKCTFSVRDQIYTGKALKPAVTVRLGGGKLKKGTDYTVSYKNNRKIGLATMTVKGKGNFRGSRNVIFRINPKATAFTKLKGGAQQITLEWKNPKNITGYQIEYSLKKNFSASKKLKIKQAKTHATTIGKLKAKKTYYVRIRTYATVNGKNYFSAWSAPRAVKTKAASANETYYKPDAVHG